MSSRTKRAQKVDSTSSSKKPKPEIEEVETTSKKVTKTKTSSKKVTKTNNKKGSTKIDQRVKWAKGIIEHFGLKPAQNETLDRSTDRILKYFYNSNNVIKISDLQNSIQHAHTKSHHDSYYLFNSEGKIIMKTDCVFFMLKEGQLKEGITITDDSGKIYFGQALPREQIVKAIDVFDKQNKNKESVAIEAKEEGKNDEEEDNEDDDEDDEADEAGEAGESTTTVTTVTTTITTSESSASKPSCLVM